MKRIFDIFLSLTLLIFLLPLFLTIVTLLYFLEGRPIFFISERMRSTEKAFAMIKFRTMHSTENPIGASGGHVSNRITRIGRFLRKYRLDEIPQIFNILYGDMSFVGPRPPLRKYVQKYPELYRRVLQEKTGVTSLSSIYLSEYEARVLESCKSSEETEALYCKLCIPKKAKLDLIYSEHKSLCFDLILLFRTFLKVISY